MPSRKWRRMANSFSGGQCSRTAKKFFGASVDAPSSFLFLDGLAPARPKDFGTAGAVSSKLSPNEFGAHLSPSSTKVSGMVKCYDTNKSCYGF